MSECIWFSPSWLTRFHVSFFKIAPDFPLSPLLLRSNWHITFYKFDITFYKFVYNMICFSWFFFLLLLWSKIYQFLFFLIVPLIRQFADFCLQAMTKISFFSSLSQAAFIPVKGREPSLCEKYFHFFVSNASTFMPTQIRRQIYIRTSFYLLNVF